LLAGLLSAFACTDSADPGTDSSASTRESTGTTASQAENPGSSPLYGLILAKSEFGANPEPATMILMRPDASGQKWNSETIRVPSGLVDLQVGDRDDGSLAYREVGKSEVFGLAPVDGQWGHVPGDAEGVTWRLKSDGKPDTKTYEMKGGNVFHKCMWWDPEFGEPGILSISGNMPYMLIWRQVGNEWKSELLWTAAVGGKEHRFRDVEVGDVDGDGHDELVVVTHDRAAIYVLEQTAEGLVATEVHRTEERLIVHEVEIGDVNGDGKLEFFTTPSEPNRSDHKAQKGWIDMYQYDAATGKYNRTVVDELAFHAKEILVVDYDGDGICELYAAIEPPEEAEEEVVTIRRYQWQDGKMVATDDIGLNGNMCRFLNLGDTDGDGVNEIIASTRTAGVFKLWIGEVEADENAADEASREKQYEWKKKKIVPSYVSSGFEHATAVFDWDGDGIDDIFLASDGQKTLNRLVYYPEKDRYKTKRIAQWPESGLYFTWGVMPLPPAK
jgi:VCBS repeat protein